MDDIVTRLRADFISHGQCDYCEQWEWRGHFSDCPYKLAADEIERLRSDLVNVRDLNEHLTTQLQTFYNEDEEANDD